MSLCRSSLAESLNRDIRGNQCRPMVLLVWGHLEHNAEKLLFSHGLFFVCRCYCIFVLTGIMLIVSKHYAPMYRSLMTHRFEVSQRAAILSNNSLHIKRDREIMSRTPLCLEIMNAISHLYADPRVLKNKTSSFSSNQRVIDHLLQGNHYSSFQKASFLNHKLDTTLFCSLTISDQRWQTRSPWVILDNKVGLQHFIMFSLRWWRRLRGGVI